MSEHDVDQQYTPTILQGIQQVTAGTSTQVQPPPTPVDPASIATPSTEALQGAVGAAFAKQQQIANTTLGQSVSASVQNWDTSRIASTFLNKPDFTPDPNFSKTQALSHVDIPVDEDSRKFLFEAQSQDEFNWRLQQLTQMRERHELAAVHPAINALVQFADPAYLASDLMSAGAASLLKLGRVAGGVLGAIGTTSVLAAASQERPVSPVELFGAAAMHGAATFIGTRVRPRAADESGVHIDTGEEDLGTVATGDQPPPTAPPTPEANQASRAFNNSAIVPPGAIRTDVNELIDNVLQHAGEELTPANRALATAMREHLGASDPVPAYVVRDKSTQSSSASLFPDDSRLIHINNNAYPTLSDTVQQMSPRQRMIILHEAAHATTLRAIRAFESGRPLPPEVAKSIADVDKLRIAARDAIDRGALNNTGTKFTNAVMYGVKDNHEFISQMFDSPQFREFLDRLPGSPHQSAYRRAVQSLVTLATGKKQSSSLLDTLTDTYSNMLKNPQLTKFTYSRNPHPEVTEDAVPLNVRSAAYKAYSQGLNNSTPTVTRPWAEWSLYKTMTNYGPEGARLAGLLLDDPLSKTGKSAASIMRETHSRFDELLTRYDNTLLNALKEDGWGFLRRIKDPVGFRRAQQSFEEKVRAEVDQRAIDPQYRGANDRVAQAVDRLGEYSQAVGRELERVGMVEPGFTAKNPYYYPRRMSIAKLESIENRLANGGDIKVGQKLLRDQLAIAVGKAAGTDASTSKALAYAMIERARRKGYGIDNSGHLINNEGRQELIDIINSNPNISDTVKLRVGQLLHESNDASKAPMLKSRIPIDMFHDIVPGVQVRDLFDDSITTLMDSYNRRISGRIALHEAGLGEPGDRQKAIEALAKSIKERPERQKATDNLNNVFKYFLGEPVGEDVSKLLRTASTLAQTTGLAAAGLWQIVEYGTLLQRFGATAVTRAALRAIPEMRALMKQMRAATVEGRQVALDTEEALTAQVANEIRMRPVMNHYEDMFTADKSPWMMRLEHARDAIMFVNMQKYIHYHQVRTMASLVVQNLRKAAEGDAKAIEAMRKYGADDDLLRRMGNEFGRHGNNLDAWNQTTFTHARRVLINAMDDGIVRARVGELPAFMEFSTLGKFLFTFRRFVGATHNKTLMNTLHNEGARGVATLMMYQYPLAVLATAANNIVSGKGFDATDPIGKLAGTAITYMGALGFASEFFGVLSGQQRSFGSPGLLFVDRAYNIVGSLTAAGKHAAHGDGTKAQHDLRTALGSSLMALPIISIIPGVRALANAVKDN